MSPALLRPGVEMSADPGFAGRVRRLVAVSGVALGVITFLAATTTDAPLWVLAMLGSGWLLMPTILAGSLGRPKLRYGLVAPAGLVGAGLIALCLGWLPDVPTAAVGWLLVTAGVLLGGILGSWFWYRLVPVPAAIAAPFGFPRLALIAVHTALVVLGAALILSS